MSFWSTKFYSYTKDMTVRRVVTADKTNWSIDGASISGFSSATFSCTVPMFLFAYNNNGSVGNLDSSIKIYSCQIYDNGTLIRDYIPCQTTAGEVGLWDDANSVFYGNAGTGTFTAGPVMAIAAAASEITELEYIQSSGSMYLNTCFKPTNNTKIAFEFQYTGTISSTYYPLFGTIGSSNLSNMFGAYMGAAGFAVDYGSQEYIALGSKTADRSVLILDQGALYVDGVLIKSCNAETFTCKYDLALLALNNQGAIDSRISTAKLYAVQIYDNGTIIRDYIAAKMSDGTVGLYDKLHGLLYINVGSGAFTAGPEVPKAPPTPSGFTSGRLTDTTVHLNWAASDGATGYKLYKNGALLNTLIDTSYTDTVHVFSSTVYAVTAYNDDGESEAATLTYYAAPENPILYLVTDRTAEDVTAHNVKGAYRIDDLNRVGAAMNYVAGRLKAQGYDPHISPKTDWKDVDWVDPAAQAVYLGDLAELRKQFTLLYSTPEVPPRILATGINTNDGLTNTRANDIEKILEDIDLLLTNAAKAWFYSGELFSGEV